MTEADTIVISMSKHTDSKLEQLNSNRRDRKPAKTRIDHFLIRHHSQQQKQNTIIPMTKDTIQSTDTMQQLRKTESEKKDVEEQLQKLRNAARSALDEKKRQIERLRDTLQQVSIRKQEEYADRKYQCTIQLKELTLKIKALRQQLQIEKNSYLNMVTQKDRLICELGEQLQLHKSQITRCEASTQEISQKMRILEISNESLHDQLLRSKTNLSILRENLKANGGINNTSRNSELGSEEKFSEFINRLFTEQSQSHKGTHTNAIISTRLMVQLEQIRHQRQERKRELAECQMYFEGLLYEESQLKVKKSSYPTAQQLSQRSSNSVELAYSDLRKQIKMIEYNEREDSIGLVLERRRLGCWDTESQFSMKHFIYQHNREKDETISIGSVLLDKTKSKQSQKDPSPQLQLEDISQTSNDLSFSKDAIVSSKYSLLKISTGVLLSALLFKVFLKILR